MSSYKNSSLKIGVIGGGFVGITLASRLLDVENTNVTVFDTDSIKIDNFKIQNYLVDEPGLHQSLTEGVKDGKLSFSLNVEKTTLSFDAIFICIGSPKTQNPRERDKNFKIILTQYLPLLAKEGLIFLRSTVEIGTTKRLSEYLDSTDRSDVSIHFAPERTAEGVALVELKVLPQLLGTAKDTEQAAKAKHFLEKLKFEVVQTENSQTAELAKLACNTWRDVTFGFSNEIALIAEHIGANALNAIQSANYNYPRASIPLPGPVGGPCLSKDTTILFNNISNSLISFNSVMLAARRTNEHLEERLIDSFRMCAIPGTKELRLCIVGASFKGIPQTNDVRNGVAVNLIERIQEQNLPIEIQIWDPIISRNDLGKFGHMLTKNLQEISPNIVLIANNSKFETNESFVKFLGELDSKVHIFDLWQLTSRISGIKATIYQLGKFWIEVNNND